jgi:hypothetical protein
LRSALALLLVSLPIIFSHPCAIHVGPLTYSLVFAPPAKINNHPSIVIINTIEFSSKSASPLSPRPHFPVYHVFFASPDTSICQNGPAVRFSLPRFSCAANQMRSLFITPVEPEIASKATEKVASGPRSAIRRQRTVRGPHARLSAETRRRRMLGMVSDARPEDFEVQILEPPSGAGGPPNESETPSGAPFQSRAMRIFEQERMRLRDTLSFERQHAPNSEMDGPLMPPVPESRDYSGIEERQREIQRLRQVRQDIRRMARRQPAPTPPYTDRDIEYMARTGTGINSPRPSSLTPALSPSHQPSTASSPLRRLSDDFSFTAQAPPYAGDVSYFHVIFLASSSDRCNSLFVTADFPMEHTKDA